MKNTTWKVQGLGAGFSHEKIFDTKEKAERYASQLWENEGWKPKVSETISEITKEGVWAYTANGKQIFVPDIKIVRSSQHLHAVPLRGSAYTMAVYEDNQDRIVGWVLSEDMGFETVKDFMKSSMYDPSKIAKFV